MKGLFKQILGCLTALSLCGSMIAVPVHISAAALKEKVDGTSGTPLGGFGTGGVKFNARLGSFAALTKAPADAYDYTALSGAKFQLYTARNGSVQTVDTMKSVVNDGRSDDDAIWPMHYANMGKTNGVQVDLTAFAPLDSQNTDNMSMPYAFYEITLTNTESSAAEAACAFQLTTDDTPAYVAGKGFSGKKRAIYGAAETGTVSAGSDSGFEKSGVLNNQISGRTNKVSVKVNLAGQETKTIRFVLAWYDNSEPEWHYYLNFYDNPGAIAQRGLDAFDRLKHNGETLVNHMRGSDLPAWFVNQIQNSLVNLTNNSMYKKDGRVAFAEGQWTCFGTMDQMWHARQIVAQIVPFYAWRELEYWARTQRNDGQIHHDFNTTADAKERRAELVAWDDTEHPDYRNVDKWVDLNCGLIISVYETMQIAGNPLTAGILQKDSIPEGTTMLDFFWPYMKKAGNRILKQVELYGSKEYPYTFDSSENSYDAGGNPNPFNASVSAVAYKIMAKLAGERGEADEAAKYQAAYEKVAESFGKRYLSDNFPEDKRVSESFFTGQWLSMHLKLGQIWSDAQTDYVLEQLDSYYHPYYWGMGTLKGTYNEWTPYTLAHYGGLLLHTRRANIFEAMQRDSYIRQYSDRNKVFDHPLDILPAVTTPNYQATSISGGKQYISMPVQWRNYNDVVGYFRDQRTKEVWVQPRLLPEMNRVMTNGMFVTPEGYGTVSCTLSGSVDQNQHMTVKAENPIEITKLHLSDNFGQNDPTVKINGQPVSFVRSGVGYDKELIVTWNGTLDENGIVIETEGDPGYTLPELPQRPSGGPDDKPSGSEKNAYDTIPAASAEGQIGVDVYTPTGQVWYVRNQNNYDNHIIFENVNFGEAGSNQIIAKVASVYQGFTLQVKLDAVSNEAVGILEVPNTGGEQNWKEASCMLNQTITGIHDVVIIFDAAGASGQEAKFVNLSSIKFQQADGRLNRSAWIGKASNNGSSLSAAWDGDIDTRWHSSYQATGKYILLDLGKSETFNKIVLEDKKGTDHPEGFRVFVSADGKNFGTPVYEGSSSHEPNLSIEFPEQTAQYIKIEITQANTSSYWSIYEMNVFLEKAYVPEIPDTNIVGIYAGSTAGHPSGIGYFNLTKNSTGTKAARTNQNTNRGSFVNGVSGTAKNIFADSNDPTMLASVFTDYYVNYIGKDIKNGAYDVKPTIEHITLPAGTYTLYYFGGNDLKVIVDLPDAQAGDFSVSVDKPSYDFAVIGSKKHKMKEITLVVNRDYTGDLTFYNDSDWLPDLYALVIAQSAPEEEKTEITGFDVQTGTVSLNRGSELSADAVLIAVGYDRAGRMTDMKYALAGTEGDVNVGAIGGDLHKVLLWENLKNMNPLCAAYSADQ